MSEISNIMSLQYQANPSALQNETKRDKEKSEKVPMYAHEDKVIEGYLFDGGSSDKKSIKETITAQTQQTEKPKDIYQTEDKSPGAPTNAAAGDFLHAKENSVQQAVTAAATTESLKAVSNVAAEKAGDTLTKMQKLILDMLEKPVSDENPETVGSSLQDLTESLQRSVKAIENANDNDYTHNHPQVAVGGGFVIDIICGELSFNVSSLLKERASEESSNAFIDALKDSSDNKAFPSFQDVLAEVGKKPTELNLQKDLSDDKEEAWATLDEILNKPSMISQAHQDIDSKKTLNLLA